MTTIPAKPVAPDRAATGARADRPPPSLRTLFTLTVMLPVLVVSVILLTISTLASRQISEKVGGQIVRGSGPHVSRDIRQYLGDAMRVSDLYVRRIAGKQLSTDSFDAWLQPMFNDLVTSPDVASICFANVRGDTTWLLRRSGHLEFGLVDGPAGGAAIEWIVDDKGTVADTPLRKYQYLAQQRPWYIAAMEHDQPVWTPVYFWFGDFGTETEIGTGYTRKIYSANNELLGVLIIDVTLGALSQFLRHIPLAEAGYTYIIDEKDQLVAASHGAVVSKTGQRLYLKDSEDPVARAVAQYLHLPATSAAGSDIHQVQLDQGPARLKITPLEPYPGINWRLVAVLPETSFLSDARTVERQSIMLAAAAVAGGLVLGVWSSRRLSRPLEKVADHVGAIGAGDLDRRLELRSARELNHLSREINRMSEGLKHRMELEHSLQVARTVQQSLLPLAPPRWHGMDVVGRTRYCESTGGDYFDFVPLGSGPTSPAMIAVGDVTGHGIGSALLMATGRAAVRASAQQDGGSLAGVLQRVNHVLAEDARHSLFMTMVLLVIDPATGAARWANAGHDPAIVYDPSADTFKQFEGGDLPLGIENDTVYRDFSANGLTPGSVIVIGTDGIWEAIDPTGQMFGKDRLRQIIRAHGRQSAEQIATAIEREHTAFIDCARIRDDITFVVVKLREPGRD